MCAFRRCLLNRSHDFGMSMTHVHDRDTGREIDQSFTFGSKKKGAFPSVNRVRAGDGISVGNNLSRAFSKIHIISIPAPKKQGKTEAFRTKGSVKTAWDSLPVCPENLRVEGDWLVQKPAFKAGVFRSSDNRSLILNNGLIRRVFRVTPNLATVAYDELTTGNSLLRAVKPEARLELDGQVYQVGGLTGQPNFAFLRADWLESMQSDPAAFQYTGFEAGKTKARLKWKRARHSEDRPYPPPGVSLTLRFAPPPSAPALSVETHYELYDGMPLMGKWLTLRNDSTQTIRLNRFVVEILGMTEVESQVEAPDEWLMPPVTIATDYSFGGEAVSDRNRTVYWEPDPDYVTQVNYRLQTPCLLEVRPPLGPGLDLTPGETVQTFRVYELIHDHTDRERRGLAIRKMYRALSPWCTENPLMLHLTATDLETVHRAIDQAADVGFEMVIFSFGSGLNMEDTSPENIAKYKAYADYAHRKGLELGGYSLLASRRISDEHDVINPTTGKTGGAIFDQSPCLGSRWGLGYFEAIKTFLSATGFDLLEHDGSYPGDVCASTAHPGHRDLQDSQWRQFALIADFYRWCRGRGIYLNVPDWYFLTGANKTAMGYRETNWSLPRAQQHIHARQNLYDGTWKKTPSMGWMFVPLVQYHGGGAEATIEPLKDHLPDYELHLMNNLGYGAQACYRGPRLYDSEETRALVIKWVQWFKKHRAILESDIIHLRRADAQNLDGMLHVNPELEEKGMALFYNPLFETKTWKVSLPLYYTGLTRRARIAIADGKPKTYALDRQFRVSLELTIPAQGMVWVVIKAGK